MREKVKDLEKKKESWKERKGKKEEERDRWRSIGLVFSAVQTLPQWVSWHEKSTVTIFEISEPKKKRRAGLSLSLSLFLSFSFSVSLCACVCVLRFAGARIGVCVCVCQMRKRETCLFVVLLLTEYNVCLHTYVCVYQWERKRLGVCLSVSFFVGVCVGLVQCDTVQCVRHTKILCLWVHGCVCARVSWHPWTIEKMEIRYYINQLFGIIVRAKLFPFQKVFSENYFYLLFFQMDWDVAGQVGFFTSSWSVFMGGPSIFFP